MNKDLRNQCHTILPGNREESPAEHFKKMAQWCEQHNIKHDTYGEGELIKAFEQKVADLLGFEAGLFVISGTMAQVTALDWYAVKSVTLSLPCMSPAISQDSKGRATSFRTALTSYRLVICSNLGP